MKGLPARGAQVRQLGLALPPDPMPAFSGTRPLKRWRYVGVYTPEVWLAIYARHGHDHAAQIRRAMARD